jgi:hypothetical protein
MPDDRLERTRALYRDPPQQWPASKVTFTSMKIDVAKTTPDPVYQAIRNFDTWLGSWLNRFRKPHA